MRSRDTARVLLLDPAGRILLMRGRLAGAPDGDRFWFTIGGGMRPGESVLQAAGREIREETGIAQVRLGPVVWLREAVIPHMETGELLLFRERYVVAHCAGEAPDRAGWDDLEKRLVDDIRWWTLADIMLSRETIYPEGLAQLLPEIIDGRLPSPPRVITTVP